MRQRFVEGGLERGLKDGPRAGAMPKLDAKQRAHVIAVACSEAPEGYARWTLRTLASKVVELGMVDTFSHEAVRQLLKNDLTPWQKREWCIPEVSADYVAAMEDVLELYQEPYDSQRPVTCFDESPVQLIAEVREPIEARPCSTLCYDVEYKRNGVRDLLLMCEPLRGSREVLVTEQRTKKDFAHAMKHLVEMYPSATVIRVVLDNLNTHKMGSLYETFPPEEACAIARKLEFHYTPKHGSWLNIAELEFAVLSKSCLNR